MAVFHLGWQAVQKEAVPEESDLIPGGTPKIRVSGAGESGVDGVYEYDGYRDYYKPPTYALKRISNGWYIVEGMGNYFYEAPDHLAGGDSGNIPKTGWQIMQGTAPAPTLSIEP